MADPLGSQKQCTLDHAGSANSQVSKDKSKYNKTNLLRQYLTEPHKTDNDSLDEKYAVLCRR